MKITWLKQTIAALFCITMLISCEYDYIEIAGPTPPLPPDTNDTTPVHQISFSLAVEPIFNEATCLNCHNGGLSLDLRPGNAYNSITDNDLVVPGDPSNSKIYTYPNPSTGTHGTKYQTQAQVDSLSLWIFQGAQNN
jgi:hypothetical protein